MSLIMLILFGLVMLVGAIAALYLKDTVSAILAAGSVSLVASLVYLLLGAPDVAMTEAAIGSALTTVVFLFSWARIQHRSQPSKSPQSEKTYTNQEEQEDHQL
jgi:uncharacterized MnhB-related membrane protein